MGLRAPSSAELLTRLAGRWRVYFIEELVRCEGESEHAVQARLPQPRLGYFGVIDERLDMGLVAHLADSRPDW